MTADHLTAKGQRGFGVAVALVLLLCSQASRAQGAYDKCKDVLVGDLFNRISDKKTSTSDEKAAAYTAIASETSDEAYEQYKEASEGKIAQSQDIKAKFDYMAVQAKVDLHFDYSRDDSKAKFQEAWSKIQSKYTSTTSSSSESAQNLVSEYASRIRDPITITAWEHCVTSSQETGVYAYGKRDAEGNPSVKVIWVPGTFGGIATAISVSFVKPQGAVIEGESPKLRIAQGTGQEFAIHYTGHSAGFDVGINGTVLNTQGEPVASFTSNTRIPPIPTKTNIVSSTTSTGSCFDRLAAGKKFEVMLAPDLEHWFEGQLTLSTLSDCPNSTTSKCFDASLTLQELSLQGVMDLPWVRSSPIGEALRSDLRVKEDPTGHKTLGNGTTERVTGRFAASSFLLFRRSGTIEHWDGSCVGKGIIGKMRRPVASGSNDPMGRFTILLDAH